MDANRRLLQTGHGANLARRAIAVMRKHEHGPLPAIQAIDRRRDARAALARKQAMFRVVTGTGCRDTRLVCAREFSARHPTVASQLRFPAVQAAVDENPCEPDFEWPRLAIRGNVTEDLDEGILDGFVGLGGISQILVGDARRPALVLRDEIRETLA